MSSQRTPGPKGSVESRLRQATAGRGGLFRWEDAKEAGWSSPHLRRRMLAGVVERVLPGVYRFTDHSWGWTERAFAAQLWGGPRSALSGITAAAIWSMLDHSPSVIDLSVARDLRPPVDWLEVRRVREWLPSEVVHQGTFTLTHPCRTLLDVAARSDRETAETALNVAIHRRLVTDNRLRRYLEEHRRGAAGSKALRQLLDQKCADRPVPTNRFETKLMRILRAARLPAPIPQYEIVRPGGRKAAIDLAYPYAMVAVEADGYEFHSGYEAWRADRARRNDLEALGWRVLQITYRDLIEKPNEVVALVRALLEPPLFGT